MLTAVAYRSTHGVGEVLLGQGAPQPGFHISLAADRAAYHRLRTRAFVHRQGLFAEHDPTTIPQGKDLP